MSHRSITQPLQEFPSMKRLTVFTAIVFLLALSYRPEVRADDDDIECKAVTTTRIAGLFDRWNRSLATLDPEQVAANYAEDAVLLPTVSNVPRSSPEAIREYFVHFLEKQPAGRIDQRWITIGCNVAWDVGLYTFRLLDHGVARHVAARYSFVYRYENGAWLIAHHHSSVLPEG
jgi:uncharacterized protein (TIGR02246 family)